MLIQEVRRKDRKASNDYRTLSDPNDPNDSKKRVERRIVGTIVKISPSTRVRQIDG